MKHRDNNSTSRPNRSSRDTTLRLAESAVMIALASVLSLLSVFKMPFGGDITAFSQLPIIVIAYRHGTKWGVFTGICHGLLQMLFGFQNFSYVKGFAAVIILVFADYLIAFGSLGLGGVFRKRIKSQSGALVLGSLLVSVLRFICHFISGVTIWGAYAADYNMAVWLYSLSYNGLFMAGEAAVTVVGAVLLSAVLDLSERSIRPRKNRRHQA